MTKALFLTCNDPTPMLEFLRGEASERKLRLFAVACCRRIWHLLDDERSREAIDLMEHYVDGQTDPCEMAIAIQSATNAARRIVVFRESPEDLAAWAVANAIASSVPGAGGQTSIRLECSPMEDALGAALQACSAVEVAGKYQEQYRLEQRAQAALLRDLFGALFHPPTVDSSWLGWNACAALKLAQTAYEVRSLPCGYFDPECLFVLADMLEEGGCSDQHALDHLRKPGDHVRGCWLLDLLLGKS